jgi:hypothetical protein
LTFGNKVSKEIIFWLKRRQNNRVMTFESEATDNQKVDEVFDDELELLP